ncbi:hypothetical protein DL98DRAFT_124149 [Cadophora sp. DSE1049]|nr:hypothetical protein DL98DRAFT_124149 [Cadophora sp. DSE1049]
MQHNNIRFSKTTAVLGPPTALSTGRRWNTPRDAAANWCQRFELRVWPRYKDYLLMTCKRNITPPSIAPNATNINYIRFPTSKNQIQTKGNEKRSSTFSCKSLISSAQLVPSMPLAHRSSAPLLALAHCTAILRFRLRFPLALMTSFAARATSGPGPGSGSSASSPSARASATSG